MIRLHKRGRVWWAWGTVNAVRVRRSLQTTIRDLADAKARQIERELLFPPAAKQAEWTDLHRAFLGFCEANLKPSSLKKYRFVLDRFGQQLESARIRRLSDISPSAISAYCMARRSDLHPTRHAAIGTEGIKADLRILRAAFYYAVRCEMVEKNPIREQRLNVEGGKTRPFSAEEIERILADGKLSRSPWMRAAIMTFLYTGLRISDVAFLIKKAIDLESGKLQVRTQKRGKDIFVPLHPHLKGAIRDHMDAMTKTQRESQFLFPTRTGRPIRPQSLDARLRRMFKRANIDGGHAHRFRDTFAVHLLDAGATLYDVAKLLGNTVAVVEKHYAPYVEELQRRGQRLVGQLDFLGGRKERENVTNNVLPDLRGNG